MKEKWIIFLFLGVCSGQDLQERQISTAWLKFGMAAAVLITVWNMVKNNIMWWEIPVGMLPGLLMMFYSKTTSGKLGEADGWMVLVTGILLGWRAGVTILMLACLAVCGMAMVLIIPGKADRYIRLPFAPFLLTGFLVWECFIAM